jgi:hypothetical protein
VEAAIEAFFEVAGAAPRVEYIHLHSVKPDCYAARVDRAVSA